MKLDEELSPLQEVLLISLEGIEAKKFLIRLRRKIKMQTLELLQYNERKEPVTSVTVLSSYH